MRKIVKISSLYLAGLIFILHALIPHLHESSANRELHQELHQQKQSDVLSFLSFVFHEYTVDGVMEFACSDDDHTIEKHTLTDQSVIVSELPYVKVSIQPKKQVHHLINESLYLVCQGTSRVRPPPVA